MCCCPSLPWFLNYIPHTLGGIRGFHKNAEGWSQISTPQGQGGGSPHVVGNLSEFALSCSPLLGTVPRSRLKESHLKSESHIKSSMRIGNTKYCIPVVDFRRFLRINFVRFCVNTILREYPFFCVNAWKQKQIYVIAWLRTPWNLVDDASYYYYY